MKKILSILITTAFSLVLQPAFAQLGGPPAGPKFDGALAKVFGDNSAFTATLESQIKPKSGDTITMPGKMSFDSGKSRIEMDLASATGLKLPPGAAEQMKAMGLDQMTTLTLPEKKALYLIYPGLKSYVENPLPDAGSTTNDDYKVTKTEMGKETVDGHPSVENKVVVTDAKGRSAASPACPVRWRARAPPRSTSCWCARTPRAFSMPVAAAASRAADRTRRRTTP